MQTPRVVQGILSEPCLAALEADTDALADCPNYWVPRQVVEGRAPALTAAEQAVQQLYRRAVAAALAPHAAEWQGAEYWCQVYERGRGLGFHFDKCEHTMAEEGRMVNPLLSSVLNLTGSSSDVVRQAPTVLIDQQYDQQRGGVAPEHPRWSSLVFPVRNQYCLFAGRQAHGVLEGVAPPPAVAQGQQQQEAPPDGERRRVTFLVNWWSQRPERVVRATAEEVAAGKLAPARDGLGHAGSSQSGSGSHGEAVAMAALSLQEPNTAAGLQGQQQQQPVRGVQLVQIEAPPLQPGDVLPVDELLERCGVCISSRGGSHTPAVADAVMIAHPGLTLAPLDEEQVDPSHPLQILAALLPTADLASESGCSSSSDGSDEA